MGDRVNYYKRYPSDYLAKTLHLTMEQDGAYNRLLDWYYANGSAIPHGQRYAIARAMKPSEKRAVDAVLAEFFTRNGEVWANDRVNREMDDATPKIEAARTNGKRGGRPPKEKPNGFSENNPLGSDSGTQSVPNRKASQIPEEDQKQKLAVVNPTPDCETSNAGAREATGGSNIPAALQAMAAQAHRDNPALAAVVRLRRRGAQWLRLTPENPEIQTAIGEGVTVESIEAMAEAYPDKPPLYVIRAARRDHASQPANIPQQDPHHGPRHASSAVAETLAAIHRRREREATTAPAIEHDAG